MDQTFDANGNLKTTALTDEQLRASAVPISGVVTEITNALPTGSNVIGHVITDSGSTTVVTGTVAVTQSTSPWVVSLASTTITGTVTISGTVTANAGTNLNTSLLALEAGGNLDTLAAKDFATQTTLALVKASTDNLDVALSTRLKPADTLAGVTTVAAVTAITNALPTGSNVIGHIITDSGSTTAVTGTVTISGTVTANAGTNLNTSLLALEAGGNLASIKDKTDNLDVLLSTRLKPADTLTAVSTVTSLSQFNGQAISLNTGTRDVGTLRVTIATDDVVPASQSGTWNIGTVTNLSQLGGTAVSMNTGVRDAGTQRVTIATNDVVPASQSGTWNIGTVTTLTGITNALPTGSNVIGHVIADSGSTTAVTGNVTVVGAAASGATKSGNPVQVGGVFNTVQPTVTTGQAVEIQSTARGAQIVAPGIEGFAVTAQVAGATATPTLSNVTSSASSVTILASNASRKIFYIHNDSTTILYLNFAGATASLTAFSVKIASQGFFQCARPCPTNAITGIWSAANGAARITEIT